MPKRKTAAQQAEEAQAMRRQVVAARVVVPNGSDCLSSALSPTGSAPTVGQGFGWSSLLSGLPGEPDDEDHEGWVERLFGNERQGADEGRARAPRDEGARRRAPWVPGLHRR